MDWTIIATSLISMFSALGVAYIGHGVKKSNDSCNDVVQEKFEIIERKLREQEEKLKVIKTDLDDNNMRTLRLDLLHAIETDPDNTMVILEMAQKYFVEMHGNCYMSKIFQEWANEHNVSVAGVFNK